MTGFGDASTESDGVHYFVEIRSLNAKYFKASIRLPEELQGLEPVLESELRKRLTRGTITLIGKASDSSADAAQVVNHEALQKYVDQLRAAPALSDGSIRLDAGMQLGLPGVLQPPGDEEQLSALVSRIHVP